MDRRTFVFLASVGALLGSIPACLSKSPSNDGSSADAETEIDAAPKGEFQVVGNLSQLQNPQDRIQARVGSTPIVVIRRSGSSTSLTALDRTCPHQGCRVDWHGSENKFVCPCHGAEFNASGQVTRGPARSPLHSYPVRVQGGQVLVQVSS